MKFVKRETTEPRYFVPEIAQAIGVSEGAIRGYFMNKSSKRPNKSTKDGLTLDDIEAVLERKRTRGDGIDFETVAEIRRRLIAEKGYVLDKTDEEAENA
jgi:hypothetical protein